MTDWSEWFVQQVKVELREKMTNLDDVWGLMFLNPDKQEIMDTAADIASRSIDARDKEILRLKELLRTKSEVIRCMEEQAEDERYATDRHHSSILHDREKRIHELEEEIRMERKKHADTWSMLQRTDKQLEREQMSNFMAPTIISDLTQTTIDQFKEIEELKAAGCKTN